jgi:tetratricopeptide (TPR) repeat protein
MAEVALAWGQALAAANDYAAALDTLRAGLDAFPEAAASGDLDTAYLETAIAWGKALVAQGKFAEAQAVLQDASARVPGDTLNTEMRALDLAWAQALIDGAQLPQAIAKITDLTERWPDSPEVQELAARLPDLYLRRADDLALDLPASYTAALEAYQLVSEKYAGSPAAQQVEPRVFALYMSYGRSQISAAEQATRQPNQEETRAALKRALEAFQQALEITPGTEEAARWVRRIGAVNPATAPVFVVAPGSQVEVVIRLPPNPPIKQQLDYRKSRVVVKATVYDHVVHAALKDAETTWSESGQLGPVVYQISIAVSGEVGGDTYRQLLDAGLYWPYYTRSYSTPSRTVGELIQHQGCVFFVIVP